MKTAKQLSIALLVFTSLSAIIISIILLLDPTGENLGLDIQDLKGSLFSDFSIPAWLMLITIGLEGLLAVYETAHARGKYYYFVIANGIILILWFLCQILYLGMPGFIQVIFFIIGIAMILLGKMFQKQPMSADATGETINHLHAGPEHQHRHHAGKKH